MSFEVPVIQARRSCQSANASSHLRDGAVSHAALYSTKHPVPPYLYLASMPPRSKAIAHTYSNGIARRKPNANRTSQVIWAFTVVIKPSSIFNIRSRSLSGLVQEHSWLRNYHLGEVDVFVLLRGAKRFVMRRPCYSMWATQGAEMSYGSNTRGCATVVCRRR